MSIAIPVSTPKVVRDLIQQIMTHPDFEEFMIDPEKDKDILSDPSIGGTHPWWSEKYLCLLDNPVVYMRRDKELEERFNACTTEEEENAIPTSAEDRATLEMRDMVAELMRILAWWLPDYETETEDDPCMNLDRVDAFENEMPGFQIIPARPLKEGEKWYADEEETYPVIRTPRGLITQNTDVSKNQVQPENIDWTV